MNLMEAVKQYEECMKGPGYCLMEPCPLHKKIKIDAGDVSDEKGELTWRVEGCTLMAMFERWLKNKKPGVKVDAMP